MVQANFLEEWELHGQEIPAEDSSCETEINKKILLLAINKWQYHIANAAKMAMCGEEY